MLTASEDASLRLWGSADGSELQALEGHEDEVFSCAFNYESDIIISASKDNTCIVWKDEYSENLK